MQYVTRNCFDYDLLVLLLLPGYMRRQDTNAKAAMESILGITDENDLYEAAGCMLRLALWPTDAL